MIEACVSGLEGTVAIGMSWKQSAFRGRSEQPDDYPAHSNRNRGNDGKWRNCTEKKKKKKKKKKKQKEAITPRSHSHTRAYLAPPSPFTLPPRSLTTTLAPRLARKSASGGEMTEREERVGRAGMRCEPMQCTHRLAQDRRRHP